MGCDLQGWYRAEICMKHVILLSSMPFKGLTTHLY